MLAFVHIPKTAGTTLHKILTHQYQKALIHHDSDAVSQTDLAARITAEGPDLIIGHFSTGLHKQIPNLRYITCLRDPVSRIISHYNHAKHDPSHYLHQPIKEKQLSLADYALSGLSGELSNGMTRMLAGLDDFHHGEVTQTTLNQALSNLENHFAGIVLSERFDEGILLLAQDLDWKTPFYLRRKVGRQDSSSASTGKAAVAAIERRNTFDRKLYEICAGRFAARASQEQDLSQKLAGFRKKNASIGKFVFVARELKSRLF